MSDRIEKSTRHKDSKDISDLLNQERKERGNDIACNWF